MKRRKVGGHGLQENGDAVVKVELDASIVLKDVSMLLPDRKKGNLILTQSHVAVAYQMNPVVTSFVIPRRKIKVCLILNVPDKAKPQWNVIICGTIDSGESPEPLIQFSIQEQPGSKICSSLPNLADTSSLTTRELVPLVFKFVPTVESDTGRGLCVSAHRGSKEGTLYFLDGWIFFGFKKPMLLINVNSVESVSYSSITRVTFNTAVRLVDGQEYEFSMIDQGEYEAINNYVVSNSLSNQSMSEARRAKQSVKPEFSHELEGIQHHLYSQNDPVRLKEPRKEPHPENHQDNEQGQDSNDDEDETYEIESGHESDSEESDSDEEEQDPAEEAEEDNES